MSKKFTLDSIREAVEAEYGSTVIEFGDREVELINPLQLPKKKRDALQANLASLKEEGVDQEVVLGESIVLVSRSEAAGKALVKAIDGNLALLLQVFNAYSEATDAGEASASQA